MNDTKVQYVLVLLLQAVIFVLLALGHGNSAWESKTSGTYGRVQGGLWVWCGVTEKGCTSFEEKDLSSADWIKVNCARAFLLLANVISIVELVLVILTVAGKTINCIPHCVLVLLQMLCSVVAAVLAIETYEILKDTANMNAGWSLLCLWIGALASLPLLFVIPGKCSKGDKYGDNEQLID